VRAMGPALTTVPVQPMDPALTTGLVRASIEQAIA
jgi:hypothetical protein